MRPGSHSAIWFAISVVTAICDTSPAAKLAVAPHIANVALHVANVANGCRKTLMTCDTSQIICDILLHAVFFATTSRVHLRQKFSCDNRSTVAPHVACIAPHVTCVARWLSHKKSPLRQYRHTYVWQCGACDLSCLYCI